jgi:hypothetical protein
MDPFTLIAKTRCLVAVVRRCGFAQPCQACPWRGPRRAAGGCPVLPLRAEIAAETGAVEPWEGCDRG